MEWDVMADKMEAYLIKSVKARLDLRNKLMKKKTKEYERKKTA